MSSTSSRAKAQGMEAQSILRGGENIEVEVWRKDGSSGWKTFP